MTRCILSWYIAVCAALVAIVQGLSVLHAITLPALLLAIAALGIAALVIVRDRIKLPDWPRQRRSFTIPLVLLPFALVLPLVAIISFALGWHMPPNNWDAMTYHLARAAYWRQWHTLAHFPTNNVRQDAFPGNAEVLLLVTLLLAHSATLAFLVQFVAYLAATVAVYGLGVQLRLRPIYALIGAGAFATMPEVVLQSTSAQNDLVVAAFTVCMAYFVVDAIQEHRMISLLLAGMSLGLAIGAKPTAVLALPGLGIGIVALLWPRRHEIHVSGALIRILATAAVFAFLLGAPWYIANKTYYGALGGPASLTQVQEVNHPTLTTLRVNLSRFLVAFIDPEGPLLLTPQTSALTCDSAAAVRGRLVAAAHIPMIEPAVEWPGTSYDWAPPCSFNEDLSWFGLAGWLSAMAALLWCIVGVMRRRMDTAWLLAAGASSFLLGASILLRWQPWQGRLLITMVALSSPLLGSIVQSLLRVRIARPVLHLCLVYVALTGLCAAIENAYKPLAAWSASPLVQQTFVRPEMTPVFKQIARTVPPNGSLDVFLTTDDWVFPLFGPHLNRYVQPLALSPGATTTQRERFSAVSYVLTHQPGYAVKAIFHHLSLSGCDVAWIDRTSAAAVPWELYQCKAHPQTLQRT